VTQSQIFGIHGNMKDAINVVEETVAELEKDEKDLPEDERRVIGQMTRSYVSELLEQYTEEPDSK
jgi:glutamyl-tRNA reductase